MTTGRPRRRRVLVALDSGPNYREPLARAAELAHEMEAELSALFIEDANLFRLVGLPATEIALGSATRRTLEARTLERELRARAAEARASLEEIARARELSWSFQVWRGQVREALREAAREADLVTLGRSTRPLARPRPRPRHRPTPAPAPVVAFWEPGESGTEMERILEVAVRMARAASAPLAIVAAVQSPARARRLRQVAEAWLAEAAISAGWRAVRPARESVLRALAQARPRLVVLEADGPAVREGLLDDILHAADAEGLLVGSADIS